MFNPSTELWLCKAGSLFYLWMLISVRLSMILASPVSAKWRPKFSLSNFFMIGDSVLGLTLKINFNSILETVQKRPLIKQFSAYSLCYIGLSDLYPNNSTPSLTPFSIDHTFHKCPIKLTTTISTIICQRGRRSLSVEAQVLKRDSKSCLGI